MKSETIFHFIDTHLAKACFCHISTPKGTGVHVVFWPFSIKGSLYQDIFHHGLVDQLLSGKGACTPLLRVWLE